MAGRVGRDPAVEQGQAGADAVGQVVADELAGFVAAREVGHQEGAEHAGEEEADDGKVAGVVAAGDVSGGDDGDNGDGAGGDGEEGGLFGGVAEAVGVLVVVDRVGKEIIG